MNERYQASLDAATRCGRCSRRLGRYGRFLHLDHSGQPELVVCTRCHFYVLATRPESALTLDEIRLPHPVTEHLRKRERG